MLRPHNKISYEHSAADMECIIDDMESFYKNGVDGFVFGSLTPKRDIDVDNCKLIMANSHGMPVTFHRAFDMSVPSKRFESLQRISDCGFSRLLTSGFAETAEIGVDLLKQLNEFVIENKLAVEIMPGCGVTILKY